MMLYVKKGDLIVGLLIKQSSRLQSRCEIINDTCITSFREKIFYCSRQLANHRAALDRCRPALNEGQINGKTKALAGFQCQRANTLNSQTQLYLVSIIPFGRTALIRIAFANGLLRKENANGTPKKVSKR